MSDAIEILKDLACRFPIPTIVRTADGVVIAALPELLAAADERDRLARMAFRALHRAKGLPVADHVFDDEMLEFYERYRASMDPEERHELEHHERVGAVVRRASDPS